MWNEKTVRSLSLKKLSPMYHAATAATPANALTGSLASVSFVARIITVISRING